MARNGAVVRGAVAWLLLSYIGACAAKPPRSTAIDSGTSGQVENDGGAGGASSTGDPTIRLGDAQTLLASGALGLEYFPDEGTSILTQSPYRIILADGLSKSTFVLEATASGSDPLTGLPSATATRILSPGGPGTFDNGYAGVSAVYRHTDGVFYAFYHAEDQESTGTIPGTFIPGFYARIGIVYSADGTTWTKGGYVIESNVHKRTPDGVAVQYDQGAAEPGAIASADGRYLYLYYTEHSRLDGVGGSARPVEICMARADLATWPPSFPTTPGPLHGVFTKYRAGTFSTDGIGGLDSPVVVPPTTSSNSLEGHVAYSRTLGKFVMIYGVDAWNERSAPSPRAVVSGLYVAFSDDGIVWRPSPTPLILDFGVVQPGLSVSWEASILWDRATDTQGWLVYGFSPNWTNPPHYMAGRRISLSPQ